MIVAAASSVPWWSALIAVALGAALTQGVNMLNSRREQQAELRRWQRERGADAISSFMGAAEIYRRSIINAMSGHGEKLDPIQAWEDMIQARSRLFQTASAPTMVLVQDYIDQAAFLGKLEDGDRQGLSTALDRVAPVFALLQNQVRVEAGLEPMNFERP